MHFGPGGTFGGPKRKEEPIKIDGSNFWKLSDEEIEELSLEELKTIAKSLWRTMPKNHVDLVKKILARKNRGDAFLNYGNAKKTICKCCQTKVASIGDFCSYCITTPLAKSMCAEGKAKSGGWTWQ